MGGCVWWGDWHFDNIASSEIDDLLAEVGGLLHVLPLAVTLNFFFGLTSRVDHSETFLLSEVFCGTPPSCLKVVGVWVMGGLQDFSVSPSPLFG